MGDSLGEGLRGGGGDEWRASVCGVRGGNLVI